MRLDPRLTAPLVALLLALAAAEAGARAEAPATPTPTPTTANLSGTWTLDPRPPAAAGAPPRTRGDLGSGWGSPLTITQDEASLTVQYAFFAPGELQPPLTFRVPLDGTEASTEVRMGRGAQVQRWRARWQGEARDELVITATHELVDPGSRAVIPVVVTRTLSLDGPSSLTVVTARAGVLGGAPSETRVTYTRQPDPPQP